MERVIKFREYRGAGRWHYWGLMEEGKFVGPCSPNSKAQQFTGLHDKDGKEIYEGDICKILYTDWPSKSNDDTRTIEQYMSDIAKMGVIEYNTDGFYFVTKDRHDGYNYSHILPGTHGFIKVIGNKFSNPELLK